MNRLDRLREEIKKDGFSWTEDGPELLELIDIHYLVINHEQDVVFRIEEIGKEDGWPAPVLGFLGWVVRRRCWQHDNLACSPPNFFVQMPRECLTREYRQAQTSCYRQLAMAVLQQAVTDYRKGPRLTQSEGLRYYSARDFLYSDLYPWGDILDLDPIWVQDLIERAMYR